MKNAHCSLMLFLASQMSLLSVAILLTDESNSYSIEEHCEAEFQYAFSFFPDVNFDMTYD